MLSFWHFLFTPFSVPYGKCCLHSAVTFQMLFCFVSDLVSLCLKHLVGAQLGFFSIVGMPLFKAMSDLFDGCQPMMDGILANYRDWEKAAEVNDVSK